MLVFSVHNERVYVDRAMSAGAKGYITKHAHSEILIAAIQKIAEGEVYIEQGLIRHEGALSSESLGTSETDDKTIIESLSAREFDVFLLLAKGLTAHKIAEELCFITISLCSSTCGSIHLPNTPCALSLACRLWATCQPQYLLLDRCFCWGS